MSGDPKLRELRPEFRTKIDLILDLLADEGFQPKISNAYRSAAQQLEKVKQGYANPGATSPGTHNWGLACDIVDKRWGWNVHERSAKFFARLCDLASAAGLVSGGTWFGLHGTREKPTHASVWNKFGLGWDVAHVEWNNPPRAWRREYLREKAGA